MGDNARKVSDDSAMLTSRPLPRWAIDRLKLPPGDEVKTLSVLSPQEVYVLALMATTQELLTEIAPHYADLIETLIRNHLLLKISLEGAGRKDIKDLVNPYRVYSLYPGIQPQPVTEEKKESKKRFKFF